MLKINFKIQNVFLRITEKSEKSQFLKNSGKVTPSVSPFHYFFILAPFKSTTKKMWNQYFTS